MRTLGLVTLIIVLLILSIPLSILAAVLLPVIGPIAVYTAGIVLLVLLVNKKL